MKRVKEKMEEILSLLDKGSFDLEYVLKLDLVPEVIGHALATIVGSKETSEGFSLIKQLSLLYRVYHAGQNIGKEDNDLLLDILVNRGVYGFLKKEKEVNAATLLARGGYSRIDKNTPLFESGAVDTIKTPARKYFVTLLKGTDFDYAHLKNAEPSDLYEELVLFYDAMIYAMTEKNVEKRGHLLVDIAALGLLLWHSRGEHEIVRDCVWQAVQCAAMHNDAQTKNQEHVLLRAVECLQDASRLVDFHPDQFVLFALFLVVEEKIDTLIEEVTSREAKEKKKTKEKSVLEWLHRHFDASKECNRAVLRQYDSHSALVVESKGVSTTLKSKRKRKSLRKKDQDEKEEEERIQQSRMDFPTAREKYRRLPLQPLQYRKASDEFVNVSLFGEAPIRGVPQIFFATRYEKKRRSNDVKEKKEKEESNGLSTVLVMGPFLDTRMAKALRFLSDLRGLLAKYNFFTAISCRTHLLGGNVYNRSDVRFDVALEYVTFELPKSIQDVVGLEREEEEGEKNEEACLEQQHQHQRQHQHQPKQQKKAISLPSANNGSNHHGKGYSDNPVVDDDDNEDENDDDDAVKTLEDPLDDWERADWTKKTTFARPDVATITHLNFPTLDQESIVQYFGLLAWRYCLGMRNTTLETFYRHGARFEPRLSVDYWEVFQFSKVKRLYQRGLPSAVADSLDNQVQQHRQALHTFLSRLRERLQTRELYSIIWKYDNSYSWDKMKRRLSQLISRLEMETEESEDGCWRSLM